MSRTLAVSRLDNSRRGWARGAGGAGSPRSLIKEPHRRESNPHRVQDVPAERFDEAADILGRLDPQTLRRVVAEDYLELYNDTWSQGDEDLDHDGFCARATPTSVDIDEDGVQIYFDDGGLFLGHSIVMSFDEELQLAEIKLAG